MRLPFLTRPIMGTLVLFQSVALSASLYATGLMAWPMAGQAPGGGQLQFLTLEDPLLGVPEGKLPFFAGWHGSATLDRRDALNDHKASLALRMTSQDGSEVITALSSPLHTADPLQTVMAQREPNVVLTRFHSTGQLLTTNVLPALQLGGDPSSPQPFAQEVVARLERGATVRGFFADGAAVLIRNVGNGQEIFLWGITFGSDRGTQHESSKTFIQMVKAPAGKAQSLAAAYRALPAIQTNPEWQQRESERMGRLSQDTAAYNRTYNVTQAEANRRNNSSNEAAREIQWARFNSSAKATGDQHQAAIDQANLIKTQRAGLHSYFAYCAISTGEVRRQMDNPNAPGPGWERCPAKD